MRMDVLYFLEFDIDQGLPWHSTISRTRQIYPASLFETLLNKVFTITINQCVINVSGLAIWWKKPMLVALAFIIHFLPSLIK
jgi:hypothetical protein